MSGNAGALLDQDSYWRGYADGHKAALDEAWAAVDAVPTWIDEEIAPSSGQVGPRLHRKADFLRAIEALGGRKP